MLFWLFVINSDDNQDLRFFPVEWGSPSLVSSASSISHPSFPSAISSRAISAAPRPAVSDMSGRAGAPPAKPFSCRTRREMRLTRTLGFPTFSRAFRVSSAFNVFPQVPLFPKGANHALQNCVNQQENYIAGINYARADQEFVGLQRIGGCVSFTGRAIYFRLHHAKDSMRTDLLKEFRTLQRSLRREKKQVEERLFQINKALGHVQPPSLSSLSGVAVQPGLTAKRAKRVSGRSGKRPLSKRKKAKSRNV